MDAMPDAAPEAGGPERAVFKLAGKHPVYVKPRNGMWKGRGARVLLIRRDWTHVIPNRF